MTTKEPDDPFDDLLNLESHFHTEGYNLGVEDGARAGRTEGRIFGLEKGYEKFAEMGRLNGRAAVWGARLLSTEESSNTTSGPSSSAADTGAVRKDDVRPLSGSERLQRQIYRLHDLTDSETISTENTEDAVSEFDERLRDGKAKAKLISRIAGEDDHASSPSPSSLHSVGHQEQHARDSKAPGKRLRVKNPEDEKRTAEIEDFVGNPRAKLSSMK